jgi:integrase
MAKSKDKANEYFTDFTLKSLKPIPGKRYVKMEPGGLAVRVGTERTFMFRYHFEGRDRWMTLGVYPAMSLSEARADKEQQRLLLKKGIDPGQRQQEKKLEYKNAPTISNLITEYWDKRLSKLKSGPSTRRLLEKDLTTSWGKRKVSGIKTRDIVLLLDNVAERAPVTRNRLHTAINGLFAFAVSRGIIDISPCANINRVDEETRDRVLSDNEVQRLWNCLDTDNKDILDIYPITKLALKLILLTGQRPGEVTGMTAQEVVKRKDGAWWEIPAERMKGRKAKDHDVPLNPAASNVIEQAKAYSGKSEYVFRTSFKKDGPLTVRALSRAVVRHLDKMKIDKFTPHDLRRTCRTGLAKLKVSDVVAEKILSHQLQGVLGVYNRSGYDMERRAALNLWEKHVLGIVNADFKNSSDSNIVDFNSLKAKRSV